MTESHEAAAAAATTTLLNCYLREADSWDIDDHLLTVALPASDGQIRVKLRHRSHTHHHRYELPAELHFGDKSTPVDLVTLTELLLESLDGAESGRGEAKVLRERILDSVRHVTVFLTHRRDEIDHLWASDPRSFVETEQALLLGHPLHPTPKTRTPMTAGEILRYSPETGGRFQLHWLAASPDIVRHDCALSASGTTAPDLSASLAGAATRWGSSRIAFPAHPWELDHLRADRDVAALFDSGALVDLGTRGDLVRPTTSVRTVYQESWPWQLKFSLHVRVTNSERVTLPKELDRAVEAARLWQTEVGAAAQQIAPTFVAVHDPAYLAVAPEGPDGPIIDGFSVLFRTNPWQERAQAAAANVTSLTSLCQDHPFGGVSRLGQIVQRLAHDRPVTGVGREWFSRFLEVVVVSLVRLYLELGLCFEAHQQNTLVELDTEGRPFRCFYRDSQGYFHRELAHGDLCRVIPHLGEASESIFPEALADERLVYYPFLNLTLGVVDALGAAGCADEEVLLGDLRRCLEHERARATRYPATLLDRLLDDDRWPCKGNLRTRWHDMDELVGDIAEQSVYVSIPNPLKGGRETLPPLAPPTALVPFAGQPGLRLTSCGSTGKAQIEPRWGAPQEPYPPNPPRTTPTAQTARRLPETSPALARLHFEVADSGKHGELLHDWLHRPHVAPWWPPELSLAETYTYLADQLALHHLDPWVVSLDGDPFAYVETYRAAEDLLAEAFPLTASDRGWHVLVGPPEVLGTGLPRLLGRAVLARLFGETGPLRRHEVGSPRREEDEAGRVPVDRVVCEPDERNVRMLRFCERLGYTRLATVDLPDKRAALMACTRAEYARRWPSDLGDPA